MGATAIFVPAPGLVGSKAIGDSLLSDPAMEAVAKEWARLSHGAGRYRAFRPPRCCVRAVTRRTSPTRTNCSRPALSATSASGTSTPAGNLMPSDLDDRVVGIDPETLRRIPRRIGIAGGDDKHAAIRAAVEGQWVNVLLTDTALLLLLQERKRIRCRVLNPLPQNSAKPSSIAPPGTGLRRSGVGVPWLNKAEIAQIFDISRDATAKS